jgi:two-component system, sensor histidine kinase
MEMPVMDGYEATHLMRLWETENRLPLTPMVALTALTDISGSVRILSAGCTLQLNNPIMRETLLQILNQLGKAREPTKH